MAGRELSGVVGAADGAGGSLGGGEEGGAAGDGFKKTGGHPSVIPALKGKSALTPGGRHFVRSWASRGAPVGREEEDFGADQREELAKLSKGV